MYRKKTSYVITLVAKNKEIYTQFKNKVTKLLSKYDINITETNNLSEFVIDYIFYCEKEVFLNIKNVLHSFNKKVDIFIQKNINRKKKIIACDMDMTVIDVETINLIAKEIIKNKNIIELTKKAMNGEISFQKSIINRTKMLKGVNVKDIIHLIKKINITPGVKSVIKTMNKFGYHTMLISGGYDIIANKIGQEIGFKEVFSNSLQVKNNVLTGNLDGKVVDRNGKLNLLNKRVSSLKINTKDTLAVGDGDNDIAMINRAGIGVAWRAYPKVKIKADVSLNTDFKSLLYIQGYFEKDIIN